MKSLFSTCLVIALLSGMAGVSGAGEVAGCAGLIELQKQVQVYRAEYNRVARGRFPNREDLKALDRKIQQASENISQLQQQLPMVSSFPSASVRPGTILTVSGTGFSTTPSANVVSFTGGKTASALSATATSLTVAVPAGAQTGPVVVTTNGIPGCPSAGSLTVLTPHVSVRIDPAATLGVDGKPVRRDLFGVAWSGSAYVATAGNSVVLTATDGANWIEEPTRIDCASSPGVPCRSKVTPDLKRIIHANNRFVALGFLDNTSVANRTFFTSAAGSVWTASEPDKGAWSYSGVAWGNGIYVAVRGDVNSADVICATSPDGSQWSVKTVPVQLKTPLRLPSIAYGDGLFVVVGSGFSLRSRDGQTWTYAAMPEPVNGIAWSKTLKLFVAPVEGGFYTSPDGKDWQGSRSGVSDMYVAVAWSERLGLFAAVGHKGAVAISPDGASWTPLVPATTQDLRDVIAAEDRDGEGRFVAVGAAGTVLNIVRDAAPPAVSVVSFAPDVIRTGQTLTINGNNFSRPATRNIVIFAGGASAAAITATATSLTVRVPEGAQSGPLRVSTNGVDSQPSTQSLTVQPPPPGISSLSPASVYPGATLTVSGTGFGATPSANVVRFAGGATATILNASATSLTVRVPEGAQSGPVSVTANGAEIPSAVGLTVLTPVRAFIVTPVSSPPVQAALHDVAWGNGRFVAAGAGGIVLHSTDGVSWRPGSVAPNASQMRLLGVAWGDGRFVAVGDAGNHSAGIPIFTSPDGVRWAASPYAGVYSDVVWGNGTYVAVGVSPDVTSTDGLNWQWGAGGNSNNRSIVYGPGLFVAVNGDRIQTSPNGMPPWVTSAGGLPARQIAWSGPLRRFVVTSAAGFFTSPDGINWSSMKSGLSGSYQAVAWSDALGIFAAVGIKGAVATSPDGVNWTPLSSGTNRTLNAVAAGGGQLVVVGEGATILQIVPAR